MSELPECTDGWNQLPVLQLFYIKGRLGWKGLRASEFREDGPYLITGTDFRNGKIDWSVSFRISKQRFVESPEIIVKPGDILITKDGTIGKVAYIDGVPFPGEASLNSHLFLVRTKSPHIDSRFAYFIFQSDSFRSYINSKQSGSTLFGLPQRVFEQFQIHHPSLSRQRKIARILTTVDNLIEQTEALIEKYKSIKQGMMHDLFTRGVDQSGQLRPPYKDAPELYKESELGWIPKEWEVSSVGDDLDAIDAGKSPNCPDQPAPHGEWGVLKVSAVQPDGFRPDENKVIQKRIFVNPSYEINAGDLLISRSNTYQLVGLVCLVASTRSKLMLCDKTLRLRFDSNVAGTEFMFWQLQQPAVRRQIEIHATGTSGSMKNISQPVIRGLCYARPPLSEQDCLVQYIAALQRNISSERQRVYHLRGLKSGLMQDLLTGKVRVNVDEAEEVTADV